MQSSFEVLTVSATGSEVAQLVSEGIAHRAVAFTRKITPFQDLLALIQLIRIMREFKPHIVHTHTPKAGLLGMLASKFCGVPIRLHTVAGLPLMESKGIKRLLLTFTETLTYSCAHRVYPNSRGLSVFIQGTLKITKSKLKLIGKGSSNGIDSAYFSREMVSIEAMQGIDQRLTKKDGALVFCFVGRLVRDKGIVELVEAFEILNMANSKLILVGPQEPTLDPLPENTLQRIRANPAIHEVGFQHDVRPWLAVSDVLVFPSYREGFPNVVMQAACMELPCIVTDINGCNEIIQHEFSGLLVPVKDSQALVEAMRIFTESPLKRLDMGKNGRKFVAANFDQRIFWNGLLEEYRGCISCTEMQEKF